MGAEVTFIACVGDDALGVSMRDGYAADGIEVEHIAAVPGVPTGTAFIWVEPGGENRIVVASGANAYLSPERIEAAAAAINGSAVLLCQLESPLDSVRSALQRARAAGLRTILNPAPATQLDESLLRLVDIVTPNEGEAARITGMDPGTDAALLAQRLLERGVRAAIITLGPDGVLLAESERHPDTMRIPAPAVNVIDTTAAGDVFSGALAALLAGGTSLVEAATRAVAAASFACTREGAQPSIPTRAELQSFEHEVSGSCQC